MAGLKRVFDQIKRDNRQRKARPTMETQEVTVKDRIGKRVTHTTRLPIRFLGVTDGWEYMTDHRDVILMAVVKTWAMVRRPGCMPYVAPIKELSPERTP